MPGLVEPPLAPGQPPPIDIVLADGGPITLRAVTPADRARIVEGFGRLSPESRRLRFHEPRQSLTDSELEFLTTIDQDRHVSWCACLPDGTGVGIARYVVDPDGRAAEIAIAVLDAHQHRGVGRALLRRLAEIASSRGIVTFHATVLAENRAMLALIERIAASSAPTQGVLRIEVPVAAVLALPL